MPWTFRLVVLAVAPMLLMACATAPRQQNSARAVARSGGAQSEINQVVETERAFAKTMADRNFKAFQTFISPEAVFFSGSTVKRGRAEVAAEWQSYFNGAEAPFSWTPDHVEVLDSGTLALSSGPVYIKGALVGRFNSIWRRDAPGQWHVVFDKGEVACAAAAAPAGS